MPLDEHDDLKALETLPPRDVDPWRREQIRRRALTELRRQARLAARPQLAWLSRTYNRFVEPALVAGATCAYLIWAIQTVSEIVSTRPLP